MRVVKSFVREDYETQKFSAASDSVRADFLKAEKILALNSPVMQFCVYTSMILISFFAAKLIVTSATYPDVPLMTRNGERALGKYFFARFGMEQFVVPFNTAVKEFAAKNGAEFVDLHTPMKEGYAGENYVDGIHLSETGHTLMSRILLTHFANRK